MGARLAAPCSHPTNGAFPDPTPEENYARYFLPVMEADVLAEMRQAIEFHLEGLRADGQPIPRPTTVAATVVTTNAA